VQEMQNEDQTKVCKGPRPDTMGPYPPITSYCPLSPPGVRSNPWKKFETANTRRWVL